MPAVVAGKVLRSTGGAVLLRLEDEREVWIPRSLIDGDSDVANGEDVEFEVPSWFARKEGLDA